MAVFNKKKLLAWFRLMRLDRPIGTLLLLYPTLWALWLSSDGQPSESVFTVFVLGVLIMRSAGCVINDYADRHIDGHVERTLARPLATGEATAKEALLLFIVLMALALALVLWLDYRLVGLAIVGAFLASTYPFLKRYTHLPQFYLGAAFGWGIPMAFYAHQGTIVAISWWLFLANICWAAAYDTVYAMVDRDDDLKVGVKSTAILFGSQDRLAVFLLHMLTIACLLMVGREFDLSTWFYAGVAVAAGLAVYQQVLIRDRVKTRCFDAFLNNNWFGAAVLFGLVLDYTLI